MPMTSGSTPPAPGHQPNQRPQPSSAAFSGMVTTHIAAASFCPLSCRRHGGLRIMFARTGFSLASDSTVVSARGASSVSTASPLRDGTVTGMISSANTRCAGRRRPADARDGQLVLFCTRRCRTAGAGSRRSRACRPARIEFAAGGGAPGPARRARCMLVRAPPQRISVEWNATLLIDSTPPAITRSFCPVLTCMQAWITDCRPEPHRRSVACPEPSRADRNPTPRRARPPAPPCWGSSGRVRHPRRLRVRCRCVPADPFEDGHPRSTAVSDANMPL